MHSGPSSWPSCAESDSFHGDLLKQQHDIPSFPHTQQVLELPPWYFSVGGGHHLHHWLPGGWHCPPHPRWYAEGPSGLSGGVLAQALCPEGKSAWIKHCCGNRLCFPTSLGAKKPMTHARTPDPLIHNPKGHPRALKPWNPLGDPLAGLPFGSSSSG